MAKKTNEHAFAEDIKQAPLVVVDFFADFEHHRKLAEDRNVMNLPTLMIFENGVAKEKVVGYRKYGDLKRYLKEKLAEC